MIHPLLCTVDHTPPPQGRARAMARPLAQPLPCEPEPGPEVMRRPIAAAATGGRETLAQDEAAELRAIEATGVRTLLRSHRTSASCMLPHASCPPVM